MPAESVGRGLNGGSTPGTGGVYWIGAQRDVLAGDIRGHAPHADLAAPPRLYGLGPLESLRGEVSREQGLDLERPLPFRIRGSAAVATLHVLDKRDGLPHNAERHEQAKVRQTLKRTAVELIGFHSRRHRGVFTPRDADVHVHVRTADGRVSGHLEDIRLEPGPGVAVPAAGWTR